MSEAVDVVEIAIRFVFVFLVQLGIVEAFIVKGGQFGSRRFWTWRDSFLLNLGLGLLGMTDRYCSQSQSMDTTEDRLA